MGATYTRQSTYADGDTINAADSNDEFDQLLAAFASSTGHTHDGTAGEGGPISSLISNTITFGTGADTDVAVTFDGNTSDGVLTWMEDEDYFQFSDDILMSTTEKLQFRDTAIYINSSADGQLDLVADTEIQIAATTIDVNGNLDVSGTVVGASTISAGTAFVPDASDGAALGTTSLEFSDLFLADAAVINLGADQDVTLTHVADTGVLLNAASVIQFRDSAINIGSPADGDLDINADDEIELNSTLIDINGNVDVSGTSTLTGNVTLGGQLIMPTVTSGHILVADGTSFEEKAVGDLAEIATVANDDVFLAVDTSGGGLKKITRSAVVAGLATSSAISNVSEDSTPQLGGNLDMNGADIVTTSNATIDLAPNGTGTVVVRGNTNSGAIVFNCESNSHGQKVYGQPHSASVTNTLMLPAGADSTLVSLVSTDTLTNKTLTSPVINTGTFGTSILPVSADGTTLGSASKEFSDLFLADAGTIQFGNDQDVTLTHVADTGVLLNAASVVQFRDSAINIGSPADGDLDINADDEIELNSTLIDINGNVEISGTLAQVGVATFTARDVHSGGITIANAGQIGSVGDADAIAIASDGQVTLTQQLNGTAADFSGDVGGANFQPDGDTAAGDNAAIGYTAAEGLILTGQGSTSDVTIKNDADADVLSIATGTTVLTIEDDVTVKGRAIGIQDAAISTSGDSGTTTMNLADHNNFSISVGHTTTLTFSNQTTGQSGNIFLNKTSASAVSLNAIVGMNAAALTAIGTAGVYHLTYYVKADSGDNSILVSVSGALT